MFSKSYREKYNETFTGRGNFGDYFMEMERILLKVIDGEG